MAKTVWAKRSEEWIKQNPGKPTMYKMELTEDIKPPDNLIHVIKNSYKIKKKNEIANDTGIYIIICEVEKYAYVGQSINMGTRMRNHRMNITNPAIPKIASYLKMREHYTKHGINAFEFKRLIKREIDIDITALTDLENKTMYEYKQLGYTLYNTNIMGNTYCPDHLKAFIDGVIAKCANNPLLIDDIKRLL